MESICGIWQATEREASDIHGHHEWIVYTEHRGPSEKKAEGVREYATFRMGGSTATLLELACGAKLETISFSGIVSLAMRSLEGELFARFMSCKMQSPCQHPLILTPLNFNLSDHTRNRLAA